MRKLGLGIIRISDKYLIIPATLAAIVDCIGKDGATYKEIGEQVKFASKSSMYVAVSQLRKAGVVKTVKSGLENKVKMAKGAIAVNRKVVYSMGD